MMAELLADKRRLGYFVVTILLGLALYMVLPPIFDSKLLAAGLKFIVFPAYSIVAGMLYTVKFGIHMSLPVALGIFFAPSALIYYSRASLIYCLMYFIVTFIGCGIGFTIYLRYNRTV